ncbi:MAG: sigma-54-dependent Fis family transcriptional regulator, partial [Proteobacteria bacterium]
MKGKVLLVDDDQMILRAWEMLLSESYEVTTASSVANARAILQTSEIDVAVVDLDFQGQEEDGLDLINFIHANYPHLSVLVLSGDTVTTRVRDAMRTRILDFIVKDSETDEALLLALKRGFQKKQSKSVDSQMFQTRSPKMLRMLSVLDRIVASNSDSPILILGEAGTGKEHTARHIGARSHSKVVTTNMANHRAEMADSALFGHLKGSFTGADQTRIGLVEQAQDGILFLDEIGETPVDVQAKLLRVIQEKEFNMVGSATTKKVDLRFIAATNRDLSLMAKEGLFRNDLLERLSTWVLRLPPLRERPEDVLFLTNEFVNSFT